MSAFYAKNQVKIKIEGSQNETPAKNPEYQLKMERVKFWLIIKGFGVLGVGCRLWV